MHPNPINHDAITAQNLEFAPACDFGVISVAGGDAPLISHVPFLLSDDGEWGELHLVQSNPIVRFLRVPKLAWTRVRGVDNTWKLRQTKPDTVREAVAGQRPRATGWHPINSGE